MIYLDNAATSYPKNESALHRAMQQYLALGASPGRGGYDLAVQAEKKVEEVRSNFKFRDLSRFDRFELKLLKHKAH